MKILHLTLKKKWFDMIASGEKKEEYRELKPYWKKRLMLPGHAAGHLFRRFDVIRFTNGYAKDAPSFDIECKGIQIDYGMMIWGAEKDTRYFVISLGEILTKQPI